MRRRRYIRYGKWEALCCRGRLKCDGTHAETRFRLSAKRTSTFKSAGGRQFSQQLAAEVCASAVVTLWRLMTHYSGRTAPLTSKRYILYIYSTDIGTEYFKHGIYSPFFSLQNAVCFTILIFGSCIIHILYTECAKIKKKNSDAKRLMLDTPCSEVVWRVLAAHCIGQFPLHIPSPCS